MYKLLTSLLILISVLNPFTSVTVLYLLSIDFTWLYTLNSASSAECRRECAGMTDRSREWQIKTEVKSKEQQRECEKWHYKTLRIISYNILKNTESVLSWVKQRSQPFQFFLLFINLYIYTISLLKKAF